jgi:hypothetical protein
MTMDPNETLKIIRDALEASREAAYKEDAFAQMACAQAAFEDLDEWLTYGGFPPKDWDWDHD